MEHEKQSEKGGRGETLEVPTNQESQPVSKLDRSLALLVWHSVLKRFQQRLGWGVTNPLYRVRIYTGVPAG